MFRSDLEQTIGRAVARCDFATAAKALLDLLRVTAPGERIAISQAREALLRAMHRRSLPERRAESAVAPLDG